MSISKVICSSLIACAFVASVQANGGIFDPIEVKTISGSIEDPKHYVNLSATGTVLINGNYSTQALYPSWTPDSHGTRAYQDITFNNLNGVDSVSFVMYSSDWDRWNVISDTRLWVHTFNGIANVDDDHGPESSFGAYVTLGPNTSITFRVSMYDIGSSNPFFFIQTAPSSSTDLLSAGYATVSRTNRYSDVIITNGN